MATPRGTRRSSGILGVFAAALVCAAGCRGPIALPLDGSVHVPRDGGIVDVDGGEPPAPACTSEPDCPACCTAAHESGALDFQFALRACACQPSTCQAACGKTLCGSGVALDAACRACLDGARAAGGACHDADVECVETAGACGVFEHCLDACPR